MAKTVKISAVATNPYPAYEPEDLVLVGTLPAGSVEAADIVDSTSIGRAVLTAANVGAAQTAVGGTTVGKAVFVAANAGAAQDAIGATATGKALITAASAAAAKTALGPAAFVAVDDTPADAAAVAADLIAVRDSLITAGWMAAS